MTFTTYHLSDFESMEQRFRTNFINSLSGFKSVNLVGTTDGQGQTNLAIFSQVFHLGANPALIGMIVRPHSVSRGTLENLLETGFFTLNHIRQEFYKQAHQTSARYDVSEFDACGFTPEYSSLHPAPYVKESRLKIGLQLEETTDIKVNNTVLVIGRVIETLVPQDCISADGYIDIEKAGTITCSSLDSYHTTERLARLAYAKPGKEVRELLND